MLNPAFPLQPCFFINVRWKQRSASWSTTEDCHNFTYTKCPSSFNSILFVSMAWKNRKANRATKQWSRKVRSNVHFPCSQGDSTECHIMMLPSTQSPVPGSCSSRVSWAKYPIILFVTKRIFPGVLKIILWHILSLPSSCKEFLNSQRIHFVLILTLNLLALWTRTLVSPCLQHSEKQTAKQLLNLNISKIIKNVWKRLKLWTYLLSMGH